MRRFLLIVAALAAFLPGLAQANSDVPTLAAGTSLTSAVMYLANAGASDNKLGFNTSQFDISSGNLILKLPTSGQILYNNSGSFGGFTQGGDCTTDTSTGTTTCTTLNTVAPGTLYPTSPGTGLAIVGTTLNLSTVFIDRSGGNAAIDTTDSAKTVQLGAHTYTLAQAGSAGFGSGWGACLLNIGATDATINATTSVFTGASGTTALVLRPGGWACPSSDGANYQTSAGNYRTTIPVALTYPPGINPNNMPMANISQARTITGIRCTPEVAAGGAATITVVKAASGVALSAGTALHSGTCNANGTAATDQDLTVTTSTLAAGDRLGITTTGTTIWTSSGVATGVVTVFVQ
jgi:hypothetical protein